MSVRTLILVGMLSLAACIDDPTFELPEEPSTAQTADVVDAGASHVNPDAAASTPAASKGKDKDKKKP